MSQSWDTLKAQGYRVVKAYLDPEAFPDWCYEHSLKLNRESRTLYAAWYTKVTDTQVTDTHFRAFQQPSDRN